MFRRGLADHPEIRMAALADGKPPDRPLSLRERQCIAIASAEPTHHLILSSADLGRDELGAAWGKLRKRIVRKTKRPLVYVATPACTSRGTGYHLHVLLWEFIWRPMVVAQAREVGFGDRPFIKQIGGTPLDRLTQTAYAIGQQHPVFGSEHHKANRSREKFKRTTFRSVQTTLRKHNPKLLSALRDAETGSVSDLELLERHPLLH